MKLFDIELLVGHTEEEAQLTAENHGLTVRILSVNGKAGIGTRDHRLDRVNFALVDGKVVRAWKG